MITFMTSLKNSFGKLLVLLVWRYTCQSKTHFHIRLEQQKYGHRVDTRKQHKMYHYAWVSHGVGCCLLGYIASPSSQRHRKIIFTKCSIWWIRSSETDTPSYLAEAIVLLSCIRVVSCLNFPTETFLGFTPPLHKKAEMSPQIMLVRFFSYHLKFIVVLPFQAAKLLTTQLNKPQIMKL
jgi:hypothetical protein